MISKWKIMIVVQIDIYSIPFGQRKDTSFYLPNTGKYILLETWNEKCKPCLQAISDLKKYLNIQNLTKYHLYESQNSSSIDERKVFQFEKIDDKESILIDKNGLLFKELGLKGNPYFLLFNPTGHLVYQYFGYHTSIKEKLINEILTKI